MMRCAVIWRVCANAAGADCSFPILLVTDLLHPVNLSAVTHLRLLFRPSASDLDQDFEGFPVAHGPVAVRPLVEAHDPIEDAAGLDPAFEDVRQQLLDVG